MAGFVSDPDMQEHLKGALHQVSANKPADYWLVLAPRANADAYRCILSALFRRGYSKAQIDAWPGGASFQLDLGLFWAIVKGGACSPDDFDTTLLKLLDRREELKEVLVTDANDALVNPLRSKFGSGGFNTGSDIFVFPDPADPSLGEVTHF